MLEGNKINLRLVERKELKTLFTWFNDPSITGKFEPIEQTTFSDLEKIMMKSRTLTGFSYFLKMMKRLVSSLI